LIKADRSRPRALPLFLAVGITGIQASYVVGAESVGELGIGMLAEIGLDGVPVSLVIADLFAAGADRQQPLQGLDVIDGFTAKARSTRRRSKTNRTKPSYKTFRTSLATFASSRFQGFCFSL
jgi:hypothetical protein